MTRGVISLRFCDRRGSFTFGTAELLCDRWAQYIRPMGTVYRFFGTPRRWRVGDWFWRSSDEPDLGIWNEAPDILSTKSASRRPVSKEEQSEAPLATYGRLPYGWYEGLGDDREVRDRAMREHHVFKTLVKYVHKDLGVHRNRTLVSEGLSGAEMKRLAAVTRKIVRLWPVRIGTFVPDFTVFRNLLMRTSSQKVLKSIERAVKAVNVSVPRGSVHRASVPRRAGKR